MSNPFYNLDENILLFHLLPYLDVSSMYQLVIAQPLLQSTIYAYLKVCRRLYFSDVFKKKSRERNMIKLAERTGNIRILDLSHFSSNGVCNAVLQAFLQNNPHVRVLNISGCGSVTFGGLRDNNLSKLEVFLANWCRHINSKCIDTLYHSPLRILSLAGVWYLDDEMLIRIIEYFPKLTCLNVSKCYKVTDVGIKMLRNCSDLEILKISHCMRVSDTSLRYLLGSCGHLRQIVMDDCKSVSYKFMEFLDEQKLLLLEKLKSNHEVRWDWISSYEGHKIRF